MIPIAKIYVPNYIIPKVASFSGEKHYTEFGTPVPIEYWKGKPDFAAISQPIIEFLRQHYSGQRIGLRMFSSAKHPTKTIDELIEIVQKIGHDRYDLDRADNKYEGFNGRDIQIFMLEIQVGQENGIYGEEQIRHAFNSFYLSPETPIRVDIGMVYDLKAFELRPVVYNGKKQEAHLFKQPNDKSAAVLAIFKIV